MRERVVFGFRKNVTAQVLVGVRRRKRESVVDSVVNVSCYVVMSGRSVSMFWLEFGQVVQNHAAPSKQLGRVFRFVDVSEGFAMWVGDEVKL